MKGLLLILSVVTCVALANANDIDLSTRIVNGRNSTRGQFPYQALLFFPRPSGGEGFCGGTLISDRWILTAGHCVDGIETFEVHLGALVTDNLNEPGRIVVRTNTSISHPLYFHPTFIWNDIALLRLNEPVQFSDTIQPVRLPQQHSWFHGIRVVASGFGLQNTSAPSMAPILQWANMTTIDNAECYRTFGVLVARLSVICTVGNERESACNGDSGGPLTNEDGVLVGLTSFGSAAGCHHGYPSVFTRVTHYLGWIRRNTGLDL